MKSNKKFSKVRWSRNLLLLTLLVAGIIACDNNLFETSPPNENLAPNTTMANIPVDGDTLFALVTLHWDGEDNDGYIDYFRYRYTTYYLSEGQSIDEVSSDSIRYHDWVDTSATSVTVAFDSPAILNYQIVETIAVDNSGNEDESPANKAFFTYPTSFPETQILYPVEDDQEIYAKSFTDEWWRGVRLKYSASDKDGKVIEYAWAVDDGEFTWTTDTVVFIHPDNFIPLEGDHTLRVISKDNTNLVDPVGDSKDIIIYEPDFTKDIIVIDETKEDNTLPDNGWVTDAIVDSFYYANFGGTCGDLEVTEWDYNLRGLPSISRLKSYKAIIWHADNYAVGAGLLMDEELIKEYLQMGGKLFISGYRVLWNYFDDSFRDGFGRLNPPWTFKSGGSQDFALTYMHVKTLDVSGIEGNLTHIEGVGNFAGTLHPDSTKVAEVWPYEGKLGHIATFREMGGFAIPIFNYHGEDARVEGLPCGLRYYGSVFDVALLGFPLWHMQGEDARRVGEAVLESFGF